MFYMQMLREQDELMGNTGFDPDMVVNSDDKYAIDLKDIAQAVEDINDEYAEESEQEELDGQDLHEDPVAECMIAIYESEHNWNIVMQAIGTHELMEAARGREMVMEAVDVKKYIDTIKEFFVKQFEKITTIVKKWMDDHAVLARTNAAFYKKHGSEIQDGRIAYGKKEGSKAMKGYNFGTTGIGTKLQGEIGNVSGSIANKSFSFDSFKDGAETLDVDAIRGRLCGATSVKSDEFRAKLKAAYFGEKGDLTAETLNKVDRILRDGGNDIRAAKDKYAKIKAMYSNILKELNKIKKDVDKSEKKSEAMGNLTKYIGSVKEASNATHVAFTTMLSAMRAEQLQALRVASAWVRSIEKKSKKDSKKEKETTKTESAGFFGALELL